MGARRKRPVFKGDLEHPMQPISWRIHDPAGLIESTKSKIGDPAHQHPYVKARDEAVAAENKEITRRMLLLFNHYGIANYDFADLAFALARDFVPGLQLMKDQPGAKTKWTPTVCARLKVTLLALMQERQISMRHAARILVTRAPWSDMSKNGATLLRRAHGTDKEFFGMIVEAVRFHAGKGPDEPLTLADLAQISNW